MDDETTHSISREVAIAAGNRVNNAVDFGKCLRASRKSLGYTQEEVALLLGCSPRLVGEMERGRGSVGFDRMLAYANGLGIDVTAFER